MLNLRGGVCKPPRTEKHFIFWEDITLKVIVKFYVVGQGWSKMTVIEIVYYLTIKIRDTYPKRTVEESSLAH